jgi:hypothetical protein
LHRGYRAGAECRWPGAGGYLGGWGGPHHGWRRPYFGGVYVSGYVGGCCRKWVFVPGFGPVLRTFCD